MVTDSGFWEPVASPLQPMNNWPGSAVALIETIWLRVKEFALGLTATRPFPTGTTVKAAWPEPTAVNNEETVGFGFSHPEAQGISIAAGRVAPKREDIPGLGYGANQTIEPYG